MNPIIITNKISHMYLLNMECSNSQENHKDINLTSAKGKKSKALEGIVPEECTITIIKEGSRPSDDDFRCCYCDINQQGTKPSVFSLIPEYSDNYVPKVSQPQFPQPLMVLRKAEYVKLDYHEYLEVCEALV